MREGFLGKIVRFRGGRRSAEKENIPSNLSQKEGSKPIKIQLVNSLISHTQEISPTLRDISHNLGLLLWVHLCVELFEVGHELFVQLDLAPY